MAGENTRSASIADFESSLNELENLVRDLEQGELSLEQSLAAFERGVKLTRDCQSALKSAEQRVEQLVQNSDGSLESRPFSTDDDQQ
ncbi:exodeoxyribonuclease VII small subunit [Marinobacter daepoensis]|uniref:Exodeoxyribonuclease 7 small subunit n=1 Tax=Marinobacter daepoensis TaxID=262077 RepID=A0ABS3BL54_9GAMM|nr:exodeoxyribonuclease VII small subunit [Marinobacter daepoensis]MBN7771576.1 exodeoxyribonuclease VII small subunit [Marinobacter daepoensis]MBY6034157.1 exodeoxyribonuclease VII small subunit [Marinobacter daepoensis]MBY6080176.1 exodeoxyribonuclease VII small subunit [Marinobacter daepoensis]